MTTIGGELYHQSPEGLRHTVTTLSMAVKTDARRENSQGKDDGIALKCGRECKKMGSEISLKMA